MRVFILGLDGLEYNIIDHISNFRNLRQSEYGKLILPGQVMVRTRAGDITPYTPLVWSSIITGRLPQESGVMTAKVAQWDNRIINKLKELTIKLGLDRVQGKGKILPLMGLRKVSWSKKIIM